MFLTAVFVVVLALTKQGLTQVVDGDEKIVQEVGSTVTIDANFIPEESEVIISLIWKHEGKDIVMFAPALNITTYQDDYKFRALIGAENYNLMLDGIEFSDSGEYVLSAVTTKQSYEIKRTLEVLASPVVSTRPIQVTDDGSETEQVLAECIAKGGSSPFTIEWYDGDLLLADTGSSTDSENAANPLLIDSVLQLRMVPEASRDYGRELTCVVNDALGRRIAEDVTLEVTEPTTTVPTTTMQAYPMITKFPKSKTITLVKEESRVLTCKATGVPEPTVTWYKEEDKLQSGVGESRIEVTANDYTDSGTYRCVASNVEGKDQKEVEISVQGPPMIIGADVLENGTVAYILDADDEYVRLLCASNAYPEPVIEWTVEGANLTEFQREHHIEFSDGSTTSFLNISTKHFIGPQSVTKVICKAKNAHGVAQKSFEITVPIVPANIGLIVGVVVALVLIVLIIVVITYLVVSKRNQGTITKSEESGIFGWSTCCAGSKVKSKELKEEDDTVTVEHVKEVNEEGTQEEKQKLTQAEEEPAKEEEESKGGEETEEKDELTNEEEKPKKSKRKIPLPMQCCKGKKKEQKANQEEGENNDAEVEEESGKETGNGDTKTTDDKQEVDRDSGKGDTLDKVLEEEKPEK
ncbi:hemicentin-2-like isoform X1 [Styela clava]